MKIMKFGGTSVGSVQGLLSVKKIVEAQEESVIVVVSALSGITDQLYKVATFASARAVSRPMPLVRPVTTTILFRMSIHSSWRVAA